MSATPSEMLIDVERLRAACRRSLGDSGDADAVGGGRFDADDHVSLVEEVGSTNQELMGAPFDGVTPAPARLLVAWRQVAGRGRRGRVWTSPPAASLTFSLAVERIAPPVPPIGWPIAVGVALAEALQPWVPDIGLKWPNDLQRQARKCAGILAETRRQAGVPALERIVTGIGFNWLPDPGRDALAGQPTIALFDDAPALSREDFVGHVFAALCRQWARFQRDGLVDSAARWQAFDTLRGREVAVIDNGRTLFTGVADGIDDSGALRVRDGDAWQTVTVGDVSVRRMA